MDTIFQRTDVLVYSSNDKRFKVQESWHDLWFLQGLRLHLEYSGTGGRSRGSGIDHAHADAWAAAYSAVAAGAALVAGLGIMAYLRRAGQ